MNAPSETQRWAIAIKQPNAWAVIHAGKDVENRSATAIHAYRPAVGHRVYIHSCKGMMRAEYERAAEFMAKIGVRCPAPDELARGGIIGSVLVVKLLDVHSAHLLLILVFFVLTLVAALIPNYRSK